MIRDNFIRDFNNLGFHDINVENGLINLTQEQIARLRAENNNWIITRVEQLNNGIQNLNLELLAFTRSHNEVIQELVRGNFFGNNEVGDNHCFRLALNNRLMQTNSGYTFGISMFEGPFVKSGWRYKYPNLVVEKPKNFRNNSRLYRELQQVFPWHSNSASRNTFVQFLASAWEHARYSEISDGARRTLASIVRIMRDNDVFTREQREHILAIARIHILEHENLCKNRAESIILAISSAIDDTLQGENARNIDNIEQMNRVILSLWRQSIVFEGINCLPGMEARDGGWGEENRISHMRRLSSALNVPWNGHEENYRPISYDTAANLLLQNNVVSLKSLCD